jgi:hypothetical protein
MTSFGTFGDLKVELDDFVATAEINRPPDNFFDRALIAAIADALEALDAGQVSVLSCCTRRANTCAGADLRGRHWTPKAEGTCTTRRCACSARGNRSSPPCKYSREAWVNLALADFAWRAGSRFSANPRMGFHHGFGLSVTATGRRRAARSAVLPTLGSWEEALALGVRSARAAH